ncbi:MAG: hypothetical protein QOD54_700 [Sphingomonadales bacterium]|nr:hypothetical protein [Sphingomonadales bacterium]
MTVYVALLRGVNLGKRNLKMDDLRRIAVELGLDDAKTYIASGNLLFRSGKGEKGLKADLEAAIAEHISAKVGVMIRTADELSGVLSANPFVKEAPNFSVAIFLDDAPPADALSAAKNVEGERIALGKREFYVHYPRGQGQSRLAIPAAAHGTARNMNTVAKLAELARKMA